LSDGIDVRRGQPVTMAKTQERGDGGMASLGISGSPS
jgi:hypothetical protein